jgi:hypothetical protein
MTSIPTTFLETDYETLEDARTARDNQATQLEAAGINCQRETLYRATDGRCVFVITLYDADSTDRDRRSESRKPQTRRTKAQTRRERAQQVDYR